MAAICRRRRKRNWTHMRSVKEVMQAATYAHDHRGRAEEKEQKRFCYYFD